MQSPTCQRLFPQKRIIANWYPYRLLKGNAAIITEHCFITTSQETSNEPPVTFRTAGAESECHESSTSPSAAVGTESECCHESSTNHSARSTSLANGDQCHENSTVSHVTIGSFFPCSLGLAYNVDMYGDLKNEAAVAEHLSQHLQRLQHLTSATVHLLLFADSWVPETTLDRCLEQFGVCRRHWPQSSMLLFERPFTQKQ